MIFMKSCAEWPMTKNDLGTRRASLPMSVKVNVYINSNVPRVSNVRA